MNVCSMFRRPAALLALTLPLALAACGRVPGQFEILNDQIPEVGGTLGCMIPVDPTQYQGEGLLDISIVRSDFDGAYLVFPLIENNLPAATNNTTDPNQIQMSGFQVDIKPLPGTTPSAAAQAVFDGAGALVHYQIPWSGGISSGGGKLSAIVDAFPVALALQLNAAGGFGTQPTLTVDLQIEALGTTNSGQHMTSDPFHFPLEICSGCLVANVAPCPFTTAPENPGNPCNPAQDAPVDCCTDSGVLICPPPVVTQ
jgi:hypothetical protein